MSGAQELADKIEADKERVAELSGRIAATKQALETAVSKANQLGVSDVAARLAKVASELEDAENGRQVLEGSLEKARWQVMSVIHGIGPGAPTGGGPKVHDSHPDGLDAVPPHERHGRNASGDELMGTDPRIGPFEKEHENADADSMMSRFKRVRRAAARNIEDLKAGGKEFVTGANSDIGSFKPEDPSTYTTTTQVPDHTPQLHSPPAVQPSPTDVVGTAIVVAVVVADAAGRLFERRKRRDNGG